jgi:hypothetical protein
LVAIKSFTISSASFDVKVGCGFRVAVAVGVYVVTGVSVGGTVAVFVAVFQTVGVTDAIDSVLKGVFVETAVGVTLLGNPQPVSIRITRSGENLA